MARNMGEKDPKASCQMFRDLSGDKAFPAHQMAQLRAWEVCDEPATAALNRSELPPWMSDISLEIALKIAARNSDKAAEVELAAEKSKQKLPQGQKLQWIKLALTRARELHQDAKIADLNRRMYMIAPRLNPEHLEKNYLSIAADYRNNREFEKSRVYYEKVLKSSHFNLDDKVAALKGIRMTYKNARNNEAHILAAERMVNYMRNAEKLNPKSAAVRQASYDAQVYLARAVWTLGRGEEAGHIFNTIEKRFKGRLPMGELYWLKGRLAEESGDFKAVTEYMEKAVQEKIGDGDLRDKIYWYTAWNERRQGNFERAAEILNELDGKTESDFTRVRALFWLAKNYDDMKKAEDSKKTLERVIELDPLGYYGLLAHKTLGLTISFKRTAPVEDAKALEGLTLDLNMAEWLALLDEKEALTALLDLASNDYRKVAQQSNEAWITIFKYYAKGGLYQKLFESLSSLTPERRKSILENQPELLFPQPWNEEVKLAALQFSGVGEELIYSIMRQESSFDPKARSQADAFGLLQILPEVAEVISRDNNIPYTEMDDLYKPQVNIPIGAAHLQELLKRHKGQFILAVASYNANENAIRNWMKTRYRGDSLEFIEEIPYEETRVYVRLVMRNLIFYSLLKSRSASIEFPSWVLKLDPS
jgi:soluble lytic murein transglycosylase